MTQHQIAGVIASLLVLAVLALTANATETPEPESTPTPTYSRGEQWMPSGWRDLDRDCRDTRQEVLVRDSLEEVTLTDGRGCRVVSGRWTDAYSSFTSRHTGSFDIDHVIPLEWAHTHGGGSWSDKQRHAFAQDMDNLVVSSKMWNRQKGSRGPAEWGPAFRRHLCRYAELWHRVLHKYPDLKPEPKEIRHLAAMHATCPRPTVEVEGCTWRDADGKCLDRLPTLPEMRLDTSEP